MLDTTGAQTPVMLPRRTRRTALTPLQQLIKERMRAKKWSYRDVEDASRDPATGKTRISRSRVQQLATKPLTRVPKVALIMGLAAGLEMDFKDVWDATAQTVGGEGLQYLYRELSPDAEVLIASYEELSPEQRTAVRAVAESLRSSRDRNAK